eukprot:gene9690-11486_t
MAMCAGDAMPSVPAHQADPSRLYAHDYHIDQLASSRKNKAGQPRHVVPPGQVENYTLIVGVALTDVMQPYQGNYGVFPGSHTKLAQAFDTPGCPPHTINPLHGPNGQSHQQLLNQVVPVTDLGEPVALRMTAGTAYFAHHETVHFVQPNVYGHTRVAVYFRIISGQRKFFGKQCWRSRPAVMSGEGEGPRRGIWTEFPGLHQKQFGANVRDEYDFDYSKINRLPYTAKLPLVQCVDGAGNHIEFRVEHRPLPGSVGAIEKVLVKYVNGQFTRSVFMLKYDRESGQIYDGVMGGQIQPPQCRESVLCAIQELAVSVRIPLEEVVGWAKFMLMLPFPCTDGTMVGVK